MFTRSEKTYLILTLVFLAAGSGIKAWRRSSIRLGPFPDAATRVLDSAQAASVADSLDTASVQNSMADGSDSLESALPIDSTGLVNGVTKGSIPRGNAMRAEAPEHPGKVDLNRADAAALTRVKGIGAKTAQAIIDHRRAHGAFRNLRELLQVKGIGEKKLEKLAPYLIL